MSQLHWDAKELKNLFPKARIVGHHGGSKDPWAVEFETEKGKRILTRHNAMETPVGTTFHFSPDVIALKLPVVTFYRGVFYFYDFKDVHGTVFRDQGHRLNYAMSEEATKMMRALVAEFGAVRM